jgi:hypothetical protein
VRAASPQLRQPIAGDALAVIEREDHVDRAASRSWRDQPPAASPLSSTTKSPGPRPRTGRPAFGHERVHAHASSRLENGRLPAPPSTRRSRRSVAAHAAARAASHHRQLTVGISYAHVLGEISWCDGVKNRRSHVCRSPGVVELERRAAPRHARATPWPHGCCRCCKPARSGPSGGRLRRPGLSVAARLERLASGWDLPERRPRNGPRRADRSTAGSWFFMTDRARLSSGSASS